jgi:hypothetical protein
MVGDGQFFEAAQVFFRDRAASILIIRIAVIDTAAQRPGFAGRAEIAALEGAEIRRHRCGIVGRRGVQQDLGFKAAEEEGMAIFLEATASSAGDAHWAGGGHVAIDFLVQFQNLAT